MVQQQELDRLHREVLRTQGQITTRSDETHPELKPFKTLR